MVRSVVVRVLFPFQEVGAQWLSHRTHGLLADEMGLGKSAQAIVASDAVQPPTLVLCPANARLQWAREFKKFSSLPRTILPLLSGQDWKLLPQHDTVICSYDLLTTSALRSALSQRTWRALICDEAHYLKGLEASRTRAVLGNGGLIHHAQRAWFVSGTPMPNHPGELWPMLYACGVTALGYEAFVDRYCDVAQITARTSRGGAVKRTSIRGVKPGRHVELRGLVLPFTLRRRKEEVMAELPPLLFSDLVVEPGEVNAELYFPDQVVRGNYLQEELEREERVLDGLVTLIDYRGANSTEAKLAALTAMQASGATSVWRRWVGHQKCEPIAALVYGELKAGAYDKIVLFAHHREVLSRLREYLREFHPVMVYGGTPAKERQAGIDRFIKEPFAKVFLGQIQSCGTAVDGLQKVCHHAIVVEPDWVPAQNAQAAMRLHRIGQTKPVNVRFAAVAGGLDEKITRVYRRKARDISAVLD